LPDIPDIITTLPFFRLPLGILQPIREARIVPNTPACLIAAGL